MKRLILIAAVAAIAAVAVWLSQRSDPRPDLSDETEAVLTQMTSGDAEAVYAAASPLFRDRVPAERFARITRDMTAGLGRFIGLGPIEEAGVVNSATGTSARVVRGLEFERATVIGELSFHEVGDTWRLLGFNIDMP